MLTARALLGLLALCAASFTTPASALRPRGHLAVGATPPARAAGVAADVPRAMRKALAGPPEEFASMAMPAPTEGGVTSDAALVPVRLAATSDGA
jgi:hypothetical protein